MEDNMRLTKKIFYDLAIYMIGLGIAIGFIFPFFSILLGVPKEIALTFTYFISCILAGITLGFANILLARKTVGERIRQLSLKMKHVESILTNKKNGSKSEACTTDDCLITIDSTDEFGESAEAFNNLVITLSEVMETHTEIQLFSEMLTSHLELSLLAEEALSQLIKNTNSNGGAVLIEKGGELVIEAVNSIKNHQDLVSNAKILKTIKTMERQLIVFPKDIQMDGIVIDFRPSELLIEPIVHKNIFLGVLILVNSKEFSLNALEKIALFNKTLSLAFRNSITHSQMQRLAALDPLTGLYNRRFGMVRLEEEFSRSIRSNNPLSVLMFDLDHFKNINDTYGHLVGDKVLMSIAKISLSAIRQGDVLMRYGGEEFICILPGASRNDAMIVAERIRIMVMDSSVKNNDQDIKVTISVGLVTYPNGDITNISQFTKMADDAMYEAKETGRNRTIAH